MKIITCIEPVYFITALAVGLFLCYLITPTPDVVVKYPTPENAGSIVYKDDADNCFKFTSKEVSCPADKKTIHKIPVHVRKTSKK